jgi:hypothetical protein
MSYELIAMSFRPFVSVEVLGGMLSENHRARLRCGQR